MYKNFIEWMQEPLGSIIMASAVAVGSLLIVASGIWVIDLAVGVAA